MVAATLWAAIPGVLKVTRGVSEVISTIMLNFIATVIVVATCWPTTSWTVPTDTSTCSTEKIPESGWFPDLAISSAPNATVAASSSWPPWSA